MFFKKYFPLFFCLIYLSLTVNSNAVNITGDNEITSDSTTQQKFNADSTSLTISNSATLDVNTKPVHINEKSDGTVTVESGSTIVGNNNSIAGDDTSGLTVTNSGTIRAKNAKAINLLDGTDATITNNSGGTIRSKTNAISASKSQTTPDSITITNSGTIYTTNGSTNTIVLHSTATDSTVTNNSGGYIYNNSTKAVVAIGTNSTLTNSGKIENKKSPDEESIQVQGSGNTITLKDGGIVIGTIQNSASNTNTLKIQHGVGQGYYYKTSGSGTFNLQDLDGNQIVQGSAGSVGQGASETQDELLGYKSLNIRKSLNRYKKNQNENKGWGETYGSFIKRDQNNSNLSLGYNFLNLGVNLIYPLERSDHILSFETARQEFKKDHNINHFSFLTGLNFSNLSSETFILGGATLHNSERTIFTNTTTTGKLVIKDTYYSANVLTGMKFKNEKSIPNVGFTTGFSITPKHNETNYYSWEQKSVLNFSTYLEDEYNFNILNEKNNLNLGWNIDFRKLLIGEEQNYQINGAKATYTQDNDLTEEVTFSANAEFINNISDTEKLSFTLDGFLSTQETSGFQASINYIMEL